MRGIRRCQSRTYKTQDQKTINSSLSQCNGHHKTFEPEYLLPWFHTNIQFLKQSAKSYLNLSYREGSSHRENRVLQGHRDGSQAGTILLAFVALRTEAEMEEEGKTRSPGHVCQKRLDLRLLSRFMFLNSFHEKNLVGKSWPLNNKGLNCQSTEAARPTPLPPQPTQFEDDEDKDLYDDHVH